MTAVLLDVFVPGHPIPQPRPRVTAHGVARDPRVTAWKETVSWYAMTRRDRKRCPSAAPLVVTLGVHRINRHAADVDNLAKPVLDAMNKIVYRDDRQVAQLHVEVLRPSDAPGVRILVRELVEWPQQTELFSE